MVSNIDFKLNSLRADWLPSKTSTYMGNENSVNICIYPQLHVAVFKLKMGNCYRDWINKMRKTCCPLPDYSKL